VPFRWFVAGAGQVPHEPVNLRRRRQPQTGRPDGCDTCDQPTGRLKERHRMT
jgi:hypothetical protein